VNRLTLQPPAPPAPPYVPPSPAGYAPVAQRPPGGGGSRRTVLLAVGGGIAFAVIVLLVLIAVTREGGVVPRGNDLDVSPGAVPSPNRPGADGAIPEGPDIFLAGGVVTVPVPEGWRPLARADIRTGPGGHPEAAVLVHDAAGLTFAAYVLGPNAEGTADVNAAADAQARQWTRDAADAQVDAPQPLPASGSITAATTVRYRFTLRGRALEGQLLAATRGDGFALFVFVDGPLGNLDGRADFWAPLRDAVVATFGS
jgi:hypothetical protein